jgi:hypothetical protein
MPAWVRRQLEDLVGLLSEVPERAKAEFQRLQVQIAMQPVHDEQPRAFYRAHVEAALPCVAGARDLSSSARSTVDRSLPDNLRPIFAGIAERIGQGSTVDRSHQTATDSRTPTLRFRVDLPANHLGPGWRERAG